MIAGRFYRASINTARSFTPTTPSKFTFSPPLRTCLSKSTAPIPRYTFTTSRNTFATMAVNTPYITLNDGNKMPQVGFGLWKVDNNTCADTVYNAIKTGYRLFDGACGTYSRVLSFSRGHDRDCVSSTAASYVAALHRPAIHDFQRLAAAVVNG
jgi:hypothetical protein